MLSNVFILNQFRRTKLIYQQIEDPQCELDSPSIH
jgi:hypothetical protein